ncbi:hypothetical protein C1646_764151 [Rhizophagus diaphanus]|nr:hypothetical protein C1646_764151 [Rhizophagus diaphanus] [Rhizophagus sp. MUCL 43196]
MQRQLPNPIRFIIDYILPWPENCINRFSCKKVYQDYLEWCECNGEKPLAKKDAGTKFSLISIDRTRSRDNGVRVYQYILDRFKIITKLHESGLGDIEEFSNISQNDLPKNETTDIPIFNVLETVLEGPTIPQKIIPPQPEHHNRVANRKNTPSPNTSKDKKASNQDDLTQALFDYMAEDTCTPVVSTGPEGTTSGTSKTSKPLEPEIDKPEVSKPSEYIKPSSNELSSTILLARQEQEKRLRKWAIDHGEDPDVFVTITEKDIRLSHEYRDRMMSDADAINFAKKDGINVNDIFYISRRERLINVEIYLCNFKNAGKPWTYVYDDEEWQKGISILQENSHLCIKDIPARARGLIESPQLVIIFFLSTDYEFVADHKLTNEMSLKELSQYVPEILELLTTGVLKGGLEAGEVNICQVSFDNTCSDETIKETAQRIVRNKLSERDVKAISRTLIKTAPDPVISLSRLSRLQRELRTLNAPEKIISATKILEITKESNKIQKECNEQCKNEGIDFPDHFSLESVKERLDEYNVSNMPDKQALADNEEQARQLLTLIQEAISSGQLRDPRKPGSIYLSRFLKKEEFISEMESYKPLLPSSLRKLGSVFASIAHGPKNPSKANTYTSEALRHSSDNHASPSKRYTIVNMRKRGELYNQAESFCIFDEN